VGVFNAQLSQSGVERRLSEGKKKAEVNRLSRLMNDDMLQIHVQITTDMGFFLLMKGIRPKKTIVEYQRSEKGKEIRNTKSKLHI